MNIPGFSLVLVIAQFSLIAMIDRWAHSIHFFDITKLISPAKVLPGREKLWVVHFILYGNDFLLDNITINGAKA